MEELTTIIVRPGATHNRWLVKVVKSTTERASAEFCSSREDSQRKIGVLTGDLAVKDMAIRTFGTRSHRGKTFSKVQSSMRSNHLKPGVPICGANLRYDFYSLHRLQPSSNLKVALPGKQRAIGWSGRRGGLPLLIMPYRLWTGWLAPRWRFLRRYNQPKHSNTPDDRGLMPCANGWMIVVRTWVQLSVPTLAILLYHREPQCILFRTSLAKNTSQNKPIQSWTPLWNKRSLQSRKRFRDSEMKGDQMAANAREQAKERNEDLL